jgi:hypothetical protein
MDDAASRGHPLHVARADNPAVPDAVSVLHVALKDIGNRFDTPMGMPGKTLEVMGGIVGSEIVEKKERVKLRYVVVPEDPLKVHPCTLDGWLTFPDFPDLSCRVHLMPPGINASRALLSRSKGHSCHQLKGSD